MELPDDDDGPGIADIPVMAVVAPRSTPSKPKSTRKPSTKTAAKNKVAKRPAMRKPSRCHQDQKPKNQTVSSSAVAPSVVLPGPDDSDVDSDELFRPSGQPAVPPSDSVLMAKDDVEHSLVTYDSDKLKDAARNVKSQVRMPYSDLAGYLTKCPPAKSEMRCTCWELYSVPRIAPHVRELGGTCRRSYDIKTFWDLGQEGLQRTVLSDISVLQPYAVVLSPPCTWVSMLMHSNWKRVSKYKRILNLLEALGHIDFSMWIAALQHECDRLFIFEHPHGSLAWQRESVT